MFYRDNMLVNPELTRKMVLIWTYTNVFGYSRWLEALFSASTIKKCKKMTKSIRGTFWTPKQKKLLGVDITKIPRWSIESTDIRQVQYTMDNGREECAKEKALWYGLTRRAMKASGSSTKLAEKENFSMPMVIYMTEIGETTKRTALASIRVQMAIAMKATGEKTNNMATASRLGRRDQVDNTTAITNMLKSMVKASILAIATHTTANG